MQNTSGVEGGLTPSEYGLPHNEFYPHQLETIQWAEEVQAVGVIEASTGSGKTTIPAALSSKQKVVTVVKTKFLQQDNYERGYGFIPLYGRGNYACPHHGSPNTALDCTFTKGVIEDRFGKRQATMADCPDAPQCIYFNQREAARLSQKTVLNYPYWLHVHQSWPAPAVLVCDEGHQLPEIILEWAGTTIRAEAKIEWGLPMFPMIRSNGSKSAFGSTMTAPEQRAVSWLVESAKIMKRHTTLLGDKAKYSKEARKDLRKAELLENKLKATLEALAAAPHDWFIRSGPGAGDDGKQAFIARPLTARHHFKHYFVRGWKLLIMSATIGDDKVFAAELGLPEHEFLRVPSRFTPEQKPIFALDVPRLGQKSKQADWDKQADEIAKGVKECPGSWSGIIHVTSYVQSKLLAERLAKRGLSSRLHVPKQGESTAKVVEDWHERMNRKPGSLLISPVLFEGYDGRLERININAKTPYPALSDDYSRCRQEYNHTLYLQRTAWILEQMMGRVRRGPEDYDTKGERMTYNALGDGGWRYVKKFFSQDFVESIVA